MGAVTPWGTRSPAAPTDGDNGTGHLLGDTVLVANHISSRDQKRPVGAADKSIVAEPAARVRARSS